MGANQEIIAELRRVLNERDEARRERDSYQRQLDAIGDAIIPALVQRIEPRLSRHPVTVIMAAGSLIAKIGEAIGCEFEDGDDLLEAVKELVRERDEAREEAARQREAVHTRACRNQSAYNSNCVCGADEHQRDLQKLAFRRGAEAMREHIAEVAERNAALEWVVELVRALPIPEEP